MSNPDGGSDVAGAVRGNAGGERATSSRAGLEPVELVGAAQASAAGSGELGGGSGGQGVLRPGLGGSSLVP